MGVFGQAWKVPNLGAEFREYRLVAYADHAVNEKVAQERNRFHTNYNLQINEQARSYITIGRFLVKEEMEATLGRWIQNICNLHTSFAVSLNNYSCFPPHMLYLRVQDMKPFQKLGAALKILDGFIQSNNCPPIELVTTPYLKIAGQLPLHIYETVVKEYAERSFYESFKVDRLVLLKSCEHMRSQIANTFSLPSPLT